MAPVVSREEWLAARKQLLLAEKEFTRRRDQLSQQRRQLPWEAVEKDYVFDGAAGKQSLSQLFDGKSQLILYHFMYDPSWDAGCPHCSFWADNFDGIIVHLRQRDANLVAISRAPHATLAAFQKRMGWTFKWLSSAGNDFNRDYLVSFTPEEVASKDAFYNYTRQDPHKSEREGLSIFYKDESGKVFHTYSAYARGIDMLNTAYHYMDLLPKGRGEGDRGPFWLKRHDEY